MLFNMVFYMISLKIIFMAFILRSEQAVEEWKFGASSIHVKQKAKQMEKAMRDLFQNYHFEILGAS